MVEYRDDAQGQSVMPVEYKHGRPSGQGHEADSIQLCAQAFCLEKMRQCHIPCGCLYYHSIRRREEVPLDYDLRERTRQAILETRQLLPEPRFASVSAQESMLRLFASRHLLDCFLLPVGEKIQ